MEEKSHRKRRYLAVAAATCVSLACGTNYAYSAWAPQFAEKLKLSATESNLIGAAGNMGMYATGIPLGFLVDKKGPYLNTALGAFAIAGGYWPLRQAYESGVGSMSIFMLCFFSFLTGTGSCGAFTAAIKVAAVNWPQHRGTATAFPLAAFGLSAFFFTSISGIFFPDSTSAYLLLLTIGTFCMVFFPVFFIYVPRPEEYHALATSEHEDSPRRDSSAMSRPTSWRSKVSSVDSGTNEDAITILNPTSIDEEASLLSNDSVPGDIDQEHEGQKASVRSHHSPRADITGLQLLRSADFWLLFLMLGLLTGIGLMTINNIGNDSNALWRAYAPDTPRDYITRRQLMHVSIISCLSFVGRLISGIGSDFLVKRLNKSRFWCLVTSSSIFALAQFAALSISNPYWLWVVSTISGLGYGALFGVYPALVADAFGVSGLSANWGFMTIAPVIWGNILNLLYGAVFDAHSKVLPEGERVCDEGLDCYRGAYVVTSIAAVVGIAGSLAAVYRDSARIKARREAGFQRID